MKIKLVACILLTLFIKPTWGQNVSSIINQYAQKQHPMLLLTNERLEQLKNLAKTDSLLNRYVNDVIFNADNLIGAKSLTYKITDSGKLSVTSEIRDRVLHLGLAYRWTNNEKYAQELRHVVTDVCSYPDWNPSHFLDVAEITLAIALSYDWLHHYWDDNTRNQMEDCLLKKGLEKGVHAYENELVKYGWWKNTTHHWNLVCNSGMLTGALALTQRYPEITHKVVKHAVRYLPMALNKYNPDGVWAEGPEYWNYATTYTAYGLSSLQTALRNHTFGLTDFPGLSDAGYFPVYTTGPTGYTLNFAESSFKHKRKPMACMFWLATTYNNLDFSNDEHRILANYNASPEHIMWYVSPQMDAKPLALNKFFDGDVQVLSLRNSWNSDATFIGVKAGNNKVYNAHLDIGNFEMDALGERWAIDLGKASDNRTINLDDNTEDNRTDNVRIGSKGHNVITVNEENQHLLAESHFIEYNLKSARPYGIINLSETYPDASASMMRGIKCLENKSVLIQDEIILADTASITWRLTTEAEVQLNGQSAVLSKNNRKLEARILAPSYAVFLVESIEQSIPKTNSKGIRQLVIYLPETTNETISVILMPRGKNTQKPEIELTKLSDW